MFISYTFALRHFTQSVDNYATTLIHAALFVFFTCMAIGEAKRKIQKLKKLTVTGILSFMNCIGNL